MSYYLSAYSWPLGETVHIFFFDKRQTNSEQYCVLLEIKMSQWRQIDTVLHASNTARNLTFMSRNRVITLISFQQKQIAFGGENLDSPLHCLCIFCFSSCSVCSAEKQPLEKHCCWMSHQRISLKLMPALLYHVFVHTWPAAFVNMCHQSWHYFIVSTLTFW